MPKLDRSLAAVLTILSLALAVAAPGRALAEPRDHGGHGAKHGPMPIAIVGVVFGGALWIVSTPFCLVFAPKHITDSFDTLVALPVRKTFGIED